MAQAQVVDRWKPWFKCDRKLHTNWHIGPKIAHQYLHSEILALMWCFSKWCVLLENFLKWHLNDDKGCCFFNIINLSTSRDKLLSKMVSSIKDKSKLYQTKKKTLSDELLPKAAWIHQKLCRERNPYQMHAEISVGVDRGVAVGLRRHHDHLLHRRLLQWRL